MAALTPHELFKAVPNTWRYHKYICSGMTLKNKLQIQEALNLGLRVVSISRATGLKYVYDYKAKDWINIPDKND